uniref:Uncharacterized protein n=1 Tax=Aegilops tauschii TaxID=37682 RepID=R7WD70_AEGTA
MAHVARPAPWAHEPGRCLLWSRFVSEPELMVIHSLFLGAVPPGAEQKGPRPRLPQPEMRLLQVQLRAPPLSDVEDWVASAEGTSVCYYTHLPRPALHDALTDLPRFNWIWNQSPTGITCSDGTILLYSASNIKSHSGNNLHIHMHG